MSYAALGNPYVCTGDRVCTLIVSYDQCCYALLHYTLDVYQMNTAELFYTGAQQCRALTMILQSLKTQPMISEIPSLCHIACTSKAHQILSPLLFQQSL